MLVQYYVEYRIIVMQSISLHGTYYVSTKLCTYYTDVMWADAMRTCSAAQEPQGRAATCTQIVNPSPGGVAQLIERVLYHSTRRAVPERSWVQSLLPSTEVELGMSTFGGMLVPVLQLISPVCKTGTSLYITCTQIVVHGPAVRFIIDGQGRR
jgi:hypothetical protein